MKSGFMMCITAMSLFAALAIPVGLAAQDKPTNNWHHHYEFINLGTFGGPQSRNDGAQPPLNNRGTVIGMADTSTPDPFYPNFNPDPDIPVLKQAKAEYAKLQ